MGRIGLGDVVGRKEENQKNRLSEAGTLDWCLKTEGPQKKRAF